jgi:hypothetical protein
MVAGEPGKEDDRAAQAVLDVMVEGLRSQRDGLRAVALVSDVRIPDSDAIRVELEHRDGHTIVVLQPYTRKRFGRVVDYRDLMAMGGDPHVWIN